MSNKTFAYCEKCGKKLIERMPNGLWRFVFGKKAEGVKLPPVYMLIHGSIKMSCIRRSCDHFNVFNYFPVTNQQIAENSGKKDEEESNK